MKILMRLFLWCVVWIAGCLLLSDLLPTHAHVGNPSLVAPVMILGFPFFASDLTDDALYLIGIPGVCFWLIAFAIMFFEKVRSRFLALK